MKKSILFAALFVMVAAASAQTFSAVAVDKKDSRMQWWREARFGMFIHWGIYAVPAQGEWYMANANVPREKYAQYAKEFDPTEFNADEWVRIAHDAGMKYLVITSKHHDGFCIFNTKATTYNAVQATPWHKDPLQALSAACRKYGVRFAVYYSIMDWHSPDQGANKPDSVAPVYNPTHFEPGKKQAYIAYMKTQLKELVTQYHPAILWFDGGWMNGWTSEDGKAIYEYSRKLDPKLVINDRAMGAGDYGTPEQQIPANGLPGQDWETCMTINNNWGFNLTDISFKSVADLLHNLIDIASKGGNYLLNVGPTAKGVIPHPEVDRLEAMGRWLKLNGESVYGTTASPFTVQLPWGRCTQKSENLYLQVFDWPKDNKLVVHGIYDKPSLVYLLADKNRAELQFEKEGDSLVINVSSKATDSICSVITLEFKGRPVVYNPPSIVYSLPVFIDTLGVNFETPTKDVEVRYTLDGTRPTMQSPVATREIALTHTTTVFAACFLQGEAVSEPAQVTLVKVSPQPAVEVQNGVRYRYYEGKWDSLPNFGALTPIRQGTLESFVLPPQKALVDYGVVYTGFLSVPQDAVYRFYTASDDGSKLYIGDSLVVNNDYQHGAVEKEGLIALAKGFHPIRVEFFQAAGYDSLSVSYGSSTIKQHFISSKELSFEK